MNAVDVLFVSGAPLGATCGQQRYERLYSEFKSFKKLSPLTAGFHCPFSFPKDELPDYADIIVLGFPVAKDYPLPPHRFLIYDICDIWWVDGWHVNLSEEHLHWLSRCDVVTVVSDFLFYEIVGKTEKPVHIVPNGTSYFDAENWKPRYSAGHRIGYFFVGSHYCGQEWWALNELVAIANIMRDRLFYFFLATDRLNPLGVMPHHLPENVKVFAKHTGVHWWDVLSFLDAEGNDINWIGLIPYRPNPIGYAASPIKAYDYLALGFPVISWNNTEVTKIMPIMSSVISGSVVKNLEQFEKATSCVISDACIAALEVERTKVLAVHSIASWTQRAHFDLYHRVIEPLLGR